MASASVTVAGRGLSVRYSTTAVRTQLAVAMVDVLEALVSAWLAIRECVVMKVCRCHCHRAR